MMKQLPCVGKVRFRTTGEIRDSRLGIGLEKLDRNLYDPNLCYDEMEQLGAKWIRIQSGWCRTEKEKGSYDFAWLDEIVDSLIRHHMKPWMCLCYGNELYTPEAVNAAGAVGRPPINSPEAKEAWARYVTACVKHFKGRVEWFEVWNEPDGKWCWRPEAKAHEYHDFALDTARAVHAANPEAKVMANFCTDHSYLYQFLDEELAKNIDAITYHRYQLDIETELGDYVRGIQDYAHSMNPDILVIQGETGAQSRYSNRGALRFIDWTPRKQTKFILRKLMSDLNTPVLFTSIFTMVDIFENIDNDDVNINEVDYGFFGVLGESFDEKGAPLGRYYRKESFTAMRTMCSLFDDTVKTTTLPVCFSAQWLTTDNTEEETPDDPANRICQAGFVKDNGAKAFAYWKATNVLTTEYEATVTLDVYGIDETMHLIDLYTGGIYDIPESQIERDETGRGRIRLNHIPIRDYPLLLTFGEFA